MPNTVRLHRVFAMASPDRMTAIGDWLSGRCRPVQRRSSPNASGLIVDGRSSTRCRLSRLWKADIRLLRRAAMSGG